MDFIDPDSLGIIEPTGLMWEPYGETPYLDLIAIYSEKGFKMRDEGAKAFHLREMNSLSETRAAVLGLRQTGLPIDVTMTVDSEGSTIHGADVLACLVVLQGLGIRSFGFKSADNNTSELLEKLIPHAKIPLSVELPSLKAAVHEELENIAACSEHIFYLRDNMVYSEPIECHYHMEDCIINAEDEGAEILTFDVPTAEDAYRFGLHCHLARVPVAIRSDNDEALETALILYNGIAIIDYLSDVPDDIKLTLAKGYNALIR